MDTQLKGATFSERMLEARKGAGMTLQNVVFEMTRLLPEPMRGSPEKVRRLETTATEANCDIHLVEFLCRLYGRTVEEVSPAVARALVAYRELVESDRIDLTGRTGGGSDVEVGETGWFSGMGLETYADETEDLRDGVTAMSKPEPQLVLAGDR